MLVSDLPDTANNVGSGHGRKEDTLGIFWAVYPEVGCWGSKQGGPHIKLTYANSPPCTIIYPVTFSNGRGTQGIWYRVNIPSALTFHGVAVWLLLVSQQYTIHAFGCTLTSPQPPLHSVTWILSRATSQTSGSIPFSSALSLLTDTLRLPYQGAATGRCLPLPCSKTRVSAPTVLASLGEGRIIKASRRMSEHGAK